MKAKQLILVFSAILALLSLPACTKKASPFPKESKRIVFLGNSITYAGKYITDIETYFINHRPQDKYEFINLGLPSETVSGLSEEGHADGQFPRPNLFDRLNSLLEKSKPDVVFVCYGMNDGIMMPFDESRFEMFKQGMTNLYRQLEESGTKKIYVMTPPIHDDQEKGLDGYNLTLDKYSEWIIEEGEKGRWDVIDLHFAMKKYLEEKRTEDPTFKLADDGVHPGEEGHWLMAKEILMHLGNEVQDKKSVEETFDGIANANKIYQQVEKRQSYLKDSWLSYVGHNRPGMNKGLPMDQALQLYADIDLEIEALKTGKDRITIACIGNSITYGVGAKYPELDSYPMLLQRLLGHEDYEVLNFGVSASTLLSSTDLPYVGTQKYQDFLESNPDIVTIKLGTNDSRMPYRTQIADSMIVQTERMIKSIKALPKSPRIILLTPASCYFDDGNNNEWQSDKVIIKEIIPRLQQIADEEGLEIIDIHAATTNLNNLFPDGLHPNEEGMKIISDNIYDIITRDRD